MNFCCSESKKIEQRIIHQGTAMTRFNKACISKSAFTQVRAAELGGHPQPKSPFVRKLLTGRVSEKLFSILFYFHGERIGVQVTHF
jgi:hypothetical protein